MKFSFGWSLKPFACISCQLEILFSLLGPVARSDAHPPGPHAEGRGFDPPVQQHSFVEIGHEIYPEAIKSIQFLFFNIGLSVNVCIKMCL